MSRAIGQAIITVLIFMAAWKGLSQLDLMNFFRVEEAQTRTEEKLGELLTNMLEESEVIIEDPYMIETLDSILNRVCKANDIDREEIHLHLVLKDEINAFAMPAGNLVIYSGLIQASENPEELSGVICHELAHIQLNHVMKKLIKEIGLSVLIAGTAGDAGPQVMREVMRSLSSSAFDRSMEREADLKGVEYLVASEIDPEPFADFMFKMALDNEGNAYPDILQWVSTHPELEERAEYIIEYGKETGGGNYTPVLSDSTWTGLKAELNSYAEDNLW